MKRKIIKLWGVGMIVVLMASLLVVGATPASAGILAYTATGLPGGLGTNQIVATDASVVEVAPNGDIFVVDQQPVAAGTADRVYKSANGGQTWQTGYIGGVTVTEQFPANSVVADLVVSPSYETDNTVFVLVNDPAVGVQVYRSTNGGLNYLPFAAVVAAVATGEAGTTIDVDPNYNNAVGGSVLVGTSDGALDGEKAAA